MATTRKKKGQPRTEAAGGAGGLEELQVSVRLSMSSDTPVYYANYMEVAQSSYEFALNVARVPAKLTPELYDQAANGSLINIEVEMQILIPPEVARGLVAALALQLAKYDAGRPQRSEGAEK